MKVVVTTNIDKVFGDLREAVQKIVEQQNPILLAGASSILALMHDRIHGEGLKANGTPLGQYANSYMRVRRKNNRGDDRKVIASLTRQMENDFTVVDAGNAVGVGFLNTHNGDKAGWIEEMYPGTYFISDLEEQVFVDAINAYISDLFE